MRLFAFHPRGYQALSSNYAPEMSLQAKHPVIIVGAGPVGLLIAIRLGQEGIQALVLEKNETLPRATRAVVYNPVVLKLLKSLGVLDTVIREAYLNTEGVVWKNMNGELVAHLKVDSDNPDEFGGVLLIGQSRMNDIFLEELKKYPSVEVVFGATCTGIEESPSTNTVKVMTWQRSNGQQDIFYEADYVIGTDGANSSVRRCLCIPFEGYSWPNWKIISTHVCYDFATEKGCSPITIIVDPVDWAVIINTGEDSNGRGCRPEDAVWRVSFGEDPSLPSSREAVLERAMKQVRKYIKADSPFKIVSTEPYYLHQRCAAQARKGRVMLAGDALHVSRPRPSPRIIFQLFSFSLSTLTTPSRPTIHLAGLVSQPASSTRIAMEMRSSVSSRTASQTRSSPSAQHRGATPGSVPRTLCRL